MIIRKVKKEDYSNICLQEEQMDERLFEIKEDFSLTFEHNGEVMLIAKIKRLGNKVFAIACFVSKNIGTHLLYVIKKTNEMINDAFKNNLATGFVFWVKKDFHNAKRLAKMLGFRYYKLSYLNNNYYMEYIKWLGE